MSDSPIMREYAGHRRFPGHRRDLWDRLEPRIRHSLIAVGLLLALGLTAAHSVRYVNLVHERARLTAENAELRERLCGAVIRGRMHACP